MKTISGIETFLMKLNLKNQIHFTKVVFAGQLDKQLH
jgi:hypothetical protein